jgi:hypothetical protein
MKSLKRMFIGLIAAGALALAVSPAQAVLSDNLTLFGPTGAFIGGITATDTQEAASAALPLFSFDHNASNPAFIGHYIEILNAAGVISDVVGVDNEGGAVPNHMAFLSTDAAGGITAAMIAAAGFTTLDASIVMTEPEMLDSRGALAVEVAMRNYINPGNPAGSYLVFMSGVPDGGSAVALLGIALAGIEGARRMIRTRKA